MALLHMIMTLSFARQSLLKPLLVALFTFVLLIL